MAKKKDPDEVDDSELLGDSQFDLEAPSPESKSSKPIVFLVISLAFAAIVAVFALYSMELGPFAKPPQVEATDAPPTVVPPSTPPPASAPVVAPPPTLPKPSDTPAKAEEDEPPAKGKKGKLAKKKAPAKKKKKKK